MAETTVERLAFVLIVFELQNLRRPYFLTQTWGKTSQHHMPGFSQTCDRLAEKLALLHWDCFPGTFQNMQRCVVEE